MQIAPMALILGPRDRPYLEAHQWDRVAHQDPASHQSPMCQERRCVVEHHDIDLAEVVELRGEPAAQLEPLVIRQRRVEIDGHIPIRVRTCIAAPARTEEVREDDLGVLVKAYGEAVERVHHPQSTKLEHRGSIARFARPHYISVEPRGILPRNDATGGSTP